jgi:hypothetical protein
LNLPDFMYPHKVSLEAYKGSAAYKPLYDAAVSLPCLLVNDVRLVRDANSGEETVSSAQLYCKPGITAPQDSRVTLPDGTVRVVMRTATYDPGTLPAPGSTVLYLA